MNPSFTPKADAAGAERFSVGSYFQTLKELVASPQSFFAGRSLEEGLRVPLLYLLFSALFHTAACMSYVPENRLLMAGIILLNAMVMPLLAAGAGLLVTRVVTRKPVSFTGLCSVYAYASGTTLLVSWIPLFFWFSEPWKWLLIAVGLFKTCGLNRWQTTLVLAGSIVLVTLFFAWLAPSLLGVKNTQG